MNKFSCSLSCTWMTTIDCLFYVSDSLSRDVSWEYIASCVVVKLLHRAGAYDYQGMEAVQDVRRDTIHQ